MLVRQDQQQGFSLVELMIVLTILAILLSVGIPSFKTWIQSAQIRTTANGMQDGLQMARAEAVRRNTVIRFTLTTDVTNACTESATGTSWVVSLLSPAAACGAALVNDAYPVPSVGASAGTSNVSPYIFQLHDGAEAAAGVAVTTSPSQSVIAFNSLGKQANAGQAVEIQFASKITGSTARALSLIVSSNGQIRLCDHKFDGLKDPQGCS